jgi:hypothetical protein
MEPTDQPTQTASIALAISNAEKSFNLKYPSGSKQFAR